MKTPNPGLLANSMLAGFFIIFILTITDHYNDRDDLVIHYLGVIYEID